MTHVGRSGGSQAVHVPSACLFAESKKFQRNARAAMGTPKPTKAGLELRCAPNRRLVLATVVIPHYLWLLVRRCMWIVAVCPGGTRHAKDDQPIGLGIYRGNSQRIARLSSSDNEYLFVADQLTRVVGASDLVTVANLNQRQAGIHSMHALR
jgi:hypothetical protein